MKISILTLFPQMFQGPFDHSIIKRAREQNLLDLSFINIREFGIGKHKVVDDTIYGGGTGMVMRVDVVERAIASVKKYIKNEKVVLLSASGTPFNQKIAVTFAKLEHLILVCGHYEGIDERIKHFVDLELSIGDFISTGGEIPSMLIVDVVSRLLPGVLSENATNNESFSFKGDSLSSTLLEYPQYTKPDTYKNLEVPKILLSGNHKEINKWRIKNAIEKTKAIRPDLLKEQELERELLNSQEKGLKKG